MAQGWFAAGLGGDVGVSFQVKVNNATLIGGKVAQDDFLVQGEGLFGGGFG